MYLLVEWTQEIPINSFLCRLKEISAHLKKNSAILEELRELLLDKKRRMNFQEDAPEGSDRTEFYVWKLT